MGEKPKLNESINAGAPGEESAPVAATEAPPAATPTTVKLRLRALDPSDTFVVHGVGDGATLRIGSTPVSVAANIADTIIQKARAAGLRIEKVGD